MGGGTRNQEFVSAPPRWVDPPTLTKKRLYQVWKGRNKFLCGGRLILGPDAKSVLLSTFLIGCPALTFCIKILLRIPTAGFSYGHAVSIVGLVLTFLDLAFLFLTSTRDPGIVPRNTKPPVVENASLDSFPTDWIVDANPELKLPRTKDVTVNGCTVKVKYCDTCLLYRPPRASHCSTCNNCIQRFDHHCPWLNQCIGARNYGTFILFITTSTILCIYVFTFSLLDLLQEFGWSWSWTVLSSDAILFSLILYCFIAVWFVGGLSVFHYYLIFTNQTTYENFKRMYGNRENPYNRGAMKNLEEILFSGAPPSLVNFREWVTEEDGATFVESINKKMDLEVGIYGKNEKQLPRFLQDFEESLEERGGKAAIVDPFFLPMNDEETREGADDDDDDKSSRRTSVSSEARR